MYKSQHRQVIGSPKLYPALHWGWLGRGWSGKERLKIGVDQAETKGKNIVDLENSTCKVLEAEKSLVS